MKPPNPPGKHHYIPEFYLKRWASPSDHKLCVMSRPYKQMIDRRLAPGATGYAKDLYLLRGYPPEGAQQIEQGFFRLADSGASDALRKLESDGNRASLNVEQRSAWTRFFVSLLTRCPEDIQLFRELWPEYLHDVSPQVEASYASGRGKNDAPTLVEQFKAVPESEREKWLFEAYIGGIDNPSLGGKLNAMPWRVYDFPEMSTVPELLASDRPIVRTDGMEAPNGHLAIPIGPRKLFVLAPSLEYLRSLDRMDRRSLAKEVNYQVVSGAVKYVYGRTASQMFFVERHFSTNIQPRLFETVRDHRRERKVAEALSAPLDVGDGSSPA